jgi:putative SOS response-associated peptidase YedK
MCYTIEINLTREQLEKRFKATLDKHLPYRKQQRANAFSLPQCPVISTEDPGKIVLKTWGLIPSWVKDEQYANAIRTKTFNAKAETLLEKPSFRHAVKSQKCLVLTNGFYEWQTRDKFKQPYYIGLRDDEAFALAGLFDNWINPQTGELFSTFTVITTAANKMMEVIHNTKKRMPVILDPKEEELWIDPDMAVDKTLSFLKPFDERLMFAEEVDKALFRKSEKNNEEPTLF